MQLPPLILLDFTSLLLVGAICVLIVAEITSSNYGITNLIINKKKLRNVAYLICFLFLFMAVFTILKDIIIS